MSEETRELDSLVLKHRSKRRLIKVSEASVLRIGRQAERIKARLGLSKRSSK
jgi:hypothetical protein